MYFIYKIEYCFYIYYIFQEMESIFDMFNINPCTMIKPKEHVRKYEIYIIKYDNTYNINKYIIHFSIGLHIYCNRLKAIPLQENFLIAIYIVK